MGFFSRLRPLPSLLRGLSTSGSHEVTTATGKASSGGSVPARSAVPARAATPKIACVVAFNPQQFSNPGGHR